MFFDNYHVYDIFLSTPARLSSFSFRRFGVNQKLIPKYWIENKQSWPFGTITLEPLEHIYENKHEYSYTRSAIWNWNILLIKFTYYVKVYTLNTIHIWTTIICVEYFPRIKLLTSHSNTQCSHFQTKVTPLKGVQGKSNDFWAKFNQSVAFSVH